MNINNQTEPSWTRDPQTRGNVKFIINDDIEWTDADIDTMFASQIKGSKEYNKKQKHLSISSSSVLEFKAMNPMHVINKQSDTDCRFNPFVNRDDYNINNKSNELMKNWCYGFVDCLFGMKDEIDKKNIENVKMQFMLQSRDIGATGFNTQLRNEVNWKNRSFGVTNTDHFTFEPIKTSNTITPVKIMRPVNSEMYKQPQKSSQYNHINQRQFNKHNTNMPQTQGNKGANQTQQINRASFQPQQLMNNQVHQPQSQINKPNYEPNTQNIKSNIQSKQQMNKPNNQCQNQIKTTTSLNQITKQTPSNISSQVNQSKHQISKTSVNSDILNNSPVNKAVSVSNPTQQSTNHNNNNINNFSLSNAKSIDFDIITELLNEQSTTTGKKKSNEDRKQRDILKEVKDIKDKEFDIIMTALKHGDKEKTYQNGLISSNIDKNPEETKDDELTTAMTCLKNVEKTNNSGSERTSASNISKHVARKESRWGVDIDNFNFNLMKTDFTAGGKEFTFQPTSKLQKWMHEMEAEKDDKKDPLDTLDKSKDKNTTTKSKTINTNVNSKKSSCISKTQVNVCLPKSSKRKYSQVNKENKNSRSKFKNPRFLRQKQNRYKLTTKQKNMKTESNENLNQTINIVGTDTPSIEIPNKVYTLANISTAQFFCLCYTNPSTWNCWICNGSRIIDVNNFHIGFYYYIIGSADRSNKTTINSDDSLFKLLINPPKPSNKKDVEIYNKSLQFFKYQYRIAAFKEYSLSKKYPSSKPFNTAISEIFSHVSSKYKSIILLGKRSYLMKVSENAATINRNMVLQVLNITKPRRTNHENDYVIELSDGYKSAFAVIEEFNPINPLITKQVICWGCKVNIGLARWVKITEKQEIEITIFYNSIRLCQNLNERWGPVKKKQFMIKNWCNLMTNGGDVINNGNVAGMMKEREQLEIKTARDSEVEMHKTQKRSNEKRVQPPEISGNIVYQFQVICCDALVFYNIFNEKTCNNIIDQSLIKRLKTRKCIINFTIKNLDIYRELKEGKVYKMMLLNISEQPVEYNEINGNYELLWNATDCVQISEEPLSKEIEYDSKYSEFVSTQSTTFGLPLRTDDLCVKCVENNYKLNWILHSPNITLTNVKGLFYRRISVKKELATASTKNTGEDMYLAFVGYGGWCTLIKLHDTNFYNLEQFKIDVNWDTIWNSDNISINCFEWNNIMFKSMSTYDDKTLRLKLDNKDEIDQRKVVLLFETNDYTTFSPLNKADEYQNILADACIKHKHNCDWIDSISRIW